MLSGEEAQRYCRQVQLAEIGVEGQGKIRAGRVMVVGLGGLGSIAAFYLAAAGVGHLKLIDRDRVALENLNRQILHSSGDIDRPKAESAAEKLNRLNPHCRLDAVYAEVGEHNAEDLVGACSVILDATDNLAARQVLNRLSVKRKVPLIYGGICGWEGMAATFIPDRTACFGCLFPLQAESAEPEPPPVLGPTAGLVASLQVLETLRLLIGLPAPLAGRLLRFNGASMEFRTLAIERNPRCPVCSRPALQPSP